MLGMAKTPSEISDDYPGVVVMLNPRWRVIAGSCGLQWILQHRRLNREKWEGQSFCRTREAIIRCSAGYTTDPAALAALEALPEWFPEKPIQTPAETALEAG